MSAEVKTARHVRRKREPCFQVSGNVRSPLDGSVWVFPPAGQMFPAKTVRPAPRSWLGKGPAGRCLVDLYTSPVHPRPPALSARPLYGQRRKFGWCYTEPVS